MASKAGAHAGWWLYAAAVNEACGNLRELPQAQVRGRATTLTADCSAVREPPTRLSCQRCTRLDFVEELMRVAGVDYAAVRGCERLAGGTHTNRRNRLLEVTRGTLPAL